MCADKRKPALNLARVTPKSNDFRTDDGRCIDVMRGGAGDGPALVLHHGTPGDATLWFDWDEIASEAGLQLVAISRPGYASSTRRPDRRIADAARDVAFVLEQFDAPWFVTVGWSGGGPHALACAALLGTRCRAAATLAGVGPYGASDLAFLDGMGPENVAEFGAAVDGEASLRAWLGKNAAALRTVTGPELAAAFGGLVSRVDKAALGGDFADRLAAAIRRGLAPGFDGWIDDDRAFLQPWGFDLNDIAIPVAVWQGDLDLMVPAAHGRWLAAHIPGAVAHVAAGDGHVSLLTAHRATIVLDLLARAGARP